MQGRQVMACPPQPNTQRPVSLDIQAAHKKGTGSTKNGRDSNPKYKGVKKYGGEVVTTGNIIIRQYGNKVSVKELPPCLQTKP